MKLLYLAGLCLLLQACGGGDPAPEPPASGPTPPQACSVDDQRQSLAAFMGDRYFWYQHLGAPAGDAATMDAYFQSMLYRPTDRYSFTQPAEAFNQAFVEGRRTGYGYTLAWDSSRTSLRVRNLEPQGPMARAGIVRGDTVLAMDGQGPEGIAAGRLPVVTTPGVARTILYRTMGGEVRWVTVLSEDFALSPLADKRVLEISRDGMPVKVGYLAYHQFVGYSTGQLSLAFTEFAAAGIQELVLDLRYNGGGSVATSRDLASMIGGSRTANKLFTYLRFNDRQVANNIRLPFNNTSIPFALPLPAGLARVVVITSPGTASASELLVNGLKPFVDVVLVGDTTYGKPFGFVPRTQCGLVYNAVQFEALNAAGFSDFANGFTPDCAATDDLDHALGDPAERRLRTALGYLATGSCGPQAQAPMSARIGSPGAAEPEFGETVPRQMFFN